MDIVERLRVCFDSGDGYWPVIICDDAIKEITRLRAELEAEKVKLAEYESRKCENCEWNDCCDKTVRSYDENGRLYIGRITGCTGAFKPKDKQT